MKGEALLALYARVADAPEAIPRLRRFVLDLAVRGRLVRQDAADKPASESLASVAAELAAPPTKRAAKRSRNPSTVASGELTFELPSSWEVSTLGEITECLDFMRRPVNGAERELRIQGKPPELLFPYFGATQQQGWIDDYLFDEELILLGEDGVPFFDKFRAKAYLVSGKTWVNNHAHVFRSATVEPRFLVHYLNVFDYTGRVAGATRSKLNQARALDIPVPVPPLAEQHRIVAKVDELMALLDQLEASRSTREAIRDRLTTAGLTRLTAVDTEAEPEAEALRTHARFILDALPALTTRADQIKQLRQTILSLAVRGKLDGQVSEKRPLQSPSKTLPEIEGPFDIPSGWRWARLRDLGTLKGGGTPSKARDDYWSGSIPWVSPKDMKVDAIHQAQLSISEAAVSATAVHLIPPRSVLFVVRGMILAHSFPVAISSVELTINQDMKALVLNPSVTPEYMLMALKGLKPEMLAKVQRSTHGTCRLEGADYADFPVPVPPLADQQRIVAKVDELMALCDRLEAAVQTSDTNRSRLLEALLHEALASNSTNRKAA